MTSYVHKESYKNPPIDEALLQVSFKSPLSWNITTPGRVYEILRERYGGEPEGQEQLSASFSTDESPGVGANFALNRQDLRVIYRDENSNRFVIAHPQYITVGSNAPYDGWLSLRARTAWVLESLGKIWKLPPVEVVSIRYINRIVLPVGRFNTDDYFNVPIQTARGGRAPFASFVQRVESALDEATRVRTTFASLAAESIEAHPFLLDIEVLRTGNFSLETALGIADQLKNAENTEFELSITDTTRGLFS